ncbi:dentin sialophosphoprotein-like isoform X7 [Heterodontus francisci]|uniref:dentin sialophosphoprotein-like isoform X7 n=1 Tax=Heterodontus francisci TaxID=7792 RepID=UPI00355B33F0
MLAKSQTKLNRFTRADKLDCDFAPCLNYATCTSYPFSSLGFLCICPPGYYGDLCEHHKIEWFTAVSFIGILIILILILALCFAICCLCHRERKKHRVFKQIRSSENCLNPLPAACASTFPRCSCPRTEGYQVVTEIFPKEKYEKRDCNHQVEPEILEYHLCATRNDHCKYCPEFTDSRQNSSVETPRMITTISKNDGHSLMDKDNLLCQNNCSDVRPDSPAQSKQCMTEDSKHDRSSKMHQTNDSCEFSHRDERSNQQNLTAVPIQCRCTSPGMDSSNAAHQSDITALELICPERSVSGTSEDSEDSTSTTESCDEMLVDKCDAECQSNYPVSRMPSEDCKSTSVALCLNKVEEISSNCQIIQSNSQAQMMPCDDLSDSTSSSQSSYQEYLSSLPTDISTPRSESSSQISLSSEIADDFVNNSECSVNSSMPSETLLNLMQRYFASGDDVKSVKISILLDKSQSDDLSHSSIVEESTSGSYCQNNSQSDSEQYSRIGLKNKCGFLHCKNNSTDVEPSLASVENHARNSSSVHSQVVVHFDSQIPSMVDGSSDRYCAEDKEPCSKTTTVRYVFTDSETDV